MIVYFRYFMICWNYKYIIDKGLFGIHIYDMVDVSAFLVTACVLPFNTHAQRCPSSGLQIDNSVKLDKWHGPDNNENVVPSC